MVINTCFANNATLSLSAQKTAAYGSKVKFTSRGKMYGIVCRLAKEPYRRPVRASRKELDLKSFQRGDRLVAKSAAAAPAGDGAFEPPAEQPSGVGGISEAAAVANVMKSILGAGCFALPWAFAQSGTVFTTAYMAAAAALCVYCISLMQRARDLAVAAAPKGAPAPSTGSYANLASATIGPLGGRVTQATVLVCCFGICSAYMVFVAATLATILVPPIVGQAVSQNTLVWCVTPLLVVLAWIRNMAGVSVISMLGNVSVLTGMIAVAAYALQLPPQAAAVPAINLAGFGQAFGSVAFLFFVHFTLPPIEASMSRRERFLPAATTGFALSVVISTLFGVIGAVYFGPGVQSVVIAMLKGQGIVIAVKLLLCLNLLCTFPVVVGSAFQILEGLVKEARGKELSSGAVYAMRTMFVVLAAVVAVGIPSFGKLLGLVGGVSCTLLTMVFPPLMLLATSARVGKPVSALEKVWMYIVMLAGAFIGYLSIVG
uniref:Amino acid auxin permease family n=1 Tax=Tetraselmis sp. GSL018 TaxID=582737 RepID=A0A061S5V1_9CHLO|mmetsp:Transcript_29276/g.69833  ORF Transcript_29276/g.69833 Transcript_29276/m.69833 type:complete len:487 (-) Transcript_29276:155-1615(-)